jgi:hypothetical protein
VSPGRRVSAAGALVLFGAGVAAAQPAGAQPAAAQPAAQSAGMPDLRAMSGRPLPVPDLAAGTVVVRVSRKLPMNGVAGVEVTAIFKTSSGEMRKRTARTAADGRAEFASLPAGAAFQAEVTVDGERLASSAFPVPPQGGTRVLLIAGLGAAGGAAAGDGANAAGGERPFTLGMVAGKTAEASDLPAGSLELRLLGEDGKPLPRRSVQLGQASKDGSSGLKVLRAESDDGGMARFAGLATGESIGYAAVIDHQGLRLGTEAFRMSATQGMRGEIRAMGRTTDPSVLRFDNRSKIVFSLGEDALEVMEQLVFKNVSDKIFDPGAAGLKVQLPEGFENAKEIEGGLSLEVHANQGLLVRELIPPSQAALFALQIRVGFFLLARGSSRVELTQNMPFGLESPFFIIPAAANLTLAAPGLRALPDRADSEGTPLKVYETDDIKPGGVLALTVGGLPSLDHTGRNVAGVLCLLLVAGAVVGARRPGAPTTRAPVEAGKLAERREKLFGELVTLERARRTGIGPGRNGSLDVRRQELVAKLETVYRDMAGREQGDSPLP